LLYYVNNTIHVQTLPLNFVNQIQRITEKDGRTNLVLLSKDKTQLMIIRASSKEETNKWLFGLQRCILFARFQKEIRIRPRRATVDMWSHLESVPVINMSIINKSFSETNLTNLHSPSNLKSGSYCAQGRRKNNEDKFICIPNLNEKFDLDDFPPQAFFGVYDGHSGMEAVDFVCCNLLHYFCNHEFFKTDPVKALTEVHEMMDKNFLSKAKKNNWKSGTTALTALLRGNKIYIANLGDSRAVLCRKEKAVALSIDHRPNRPEETARVIAANGWIESTEVLNIPRLYRKHLEEEELEEEEAMKLIGWVTVTRVNGCLGMTRSIGDILIKDWRDIQFPDTEFKGDLVIPTPEIHVETIDRMNDRFLILATDGLWDIFSNQEAVDFVRSSLLRKKNLDKIAEELVEMGIELGSLDNITVVILQFQ